MFIRTYSLLTVTFLLSFSLVFADDAPKMQTFDNATGIEIDSLNIDGVNAFLTDVVSSNDPDAPITCGLFRMEAGEPLVYTYTYDEAKVIIEGEMTIAEEGGETFTAGPGDVVYFDEGATITFTSDSSGLGFYCGQRALGEL